VTASVFLLAARRLSHNVSDSNISQNVNIYAVHFGTLNTNIIWFFTWNTWQNIMGFHEHINEPSGFIEGGDFHD